MTRRVFYLSVAIAFSWTSMLATQNPTSLQKASIQGSVTRAGLAQPLAGVRVSLVRVDTDTSIPATATTDSAGHFLVTGIDPGPYRIAVERDGFIRQEFGQKRLGGNGSVVSLITGQRLTLELQMVPAGVISGRILNDLGEPLIGATVQAQTYQYINGRRILTFPRTAAVSNAGYAPTPGGRSTTNDLGEYRLYWLPPGDYYLNVTAPPQWASSATVDVSAPRLERPYLGGFTAHELPESLAPIYFPGVTDAASASPVTVSAAAEVPNIDFTWHPVRLMTIRGRIVAPPPVPAIGTGGRQVTSRSAQVTLTGVDGQRINASGQGGGGNDLFEIRGVATGSYYVVAAVGAGQLIHTGRVRVDLRDADLNDVTIQTRPPITVRGRVTSAADAPTEFQMTQLFVGLSQTGELPGFNSTQNTRVAADGAFSLGPFPPTEYRINVSGWPPGSYLESARFGRVDALAEPFTPTDGPDALELEIGFTPGRVTATVLDPAGVANSGALATLIPDGPRRSRRDLYFAMPSDQRGRVNFTNVPPGNYHLFAWEDIPSGAYENAEFIRRFEALGTPIRVDKGATMESAVTLIPATP